VVGLLLDLLAVYFRPQEMKVFHQHLVRNRDWLGRLIVDHKAYCETDYEEFERKFGGSPVAKDRRARFGISLLWNRVGYKSDGWHSLLMERGAQKIPPRIALTNSWEYASAGAALGSTHPDVLRGMFQRTHKSVPEKEWRSAYVAGLNIGPEQPQTSYAEAEATENKNFMEFCQQFRPDLYAILKN